jgi:iron complex transport system substrate-binding protein
MAAGRRRRLSLAAPLFAMLLAGCARDGAPPDGAPRLVSTAPNLTECVCAIGAGGMLAGRTDVCDYPPAAVRDVPVTGGFGTPWLEPLLAARPTHVLETVLADPAIRERLVALGIPVVHVPCARLSEIPDALRQLGALTGRETQAGALAARIERGLAGEEPGGTGSPLPAPRVLLLFAPDTPITAGRDVFIAELLERAGGVNLGRDSTADYYHVSLEWIIGQDPDLLLCVFDTAGRAPLSFFISQTGWKALRAVREGRVYTVSDLGSVSRPGPRVLEGLAQLKAVLARDARHHAPPR